MSKNKNKDKDKKYKEKHGIELGRFEDGLTYARIGHKDNILIDIEALSFTHVPPSGFRLKEFKRSAQHFLDDYTVYLIGRKPNVPEDYSFTDVAADYATMILREFNGPVDIMGTSTGGQIAHYLAADHPDVVQKLVIISAAFRLSEKGAEIEARVAGYFKQGRYGKSFTTLLDMIWTNRILKRIAKSLTRLVGKRVVGDVKYPNDLLTEIRGDCEMNFKDRLKEIKAPTLVLIGENDIAYAAEDARTTAECIPNAELILYEGQGHGLTMSNGKQVYKDVMGFLKK